MIEKMESITPYRNVEERSNPFDEIDALLEKSEGNKSSTAKTQSALEDRLRKKAIEKFAKYVVATGSDFKEFEKKFVPYLKGVPKNPAMKYLSTLIILDELNDSFENLGIGLPDKVTALDVGAGRNWFYSAALHNFIQNYNTRVPREVKLDGVDPLLTEEDIQRFKKQSNEQTTNLIKKNVLEINHQGQYDFIFMHRMLTSPSHFRTFGLDPVSLEDIMNKCQDMLTPSGVQVMISPQSAGEYYKLVEHIPEGRRVGEFNYAVRLGNEQLDQLFTPGILRNYRDGICISKK